ncbi:MAG: ABC transporter ATP-binding protein [Candidatus Dormibacteraceae bacterium]
MTPVPFAPAAPSAVDAAQVVQLTNVSKSFQAGRRLIPAVDRVSMRIHRGRFVSVVGLSGCGKSTLLRIVAGLSSPDAGAVSIFGESPAAAASAKHIGFVPQMPALLSWRTALGNVRLSLQVNASANPDRGRTGATGEDRAREVLEALGLASALDLRPGQLSGGMQQRVALARAFVFDPSILLMDEPFSALDEITREEQGKHLLRVWEANQKTVLFVTHSIPEAIALSDAVYVMSGTPGTIQTVVPVDLPRPRPEGVESTSAFHELEDRLRSELRRAREGRRGDPDRRGSR